MKTININDFISLYNDRQELRIIDVRSPAEFKGAHLKGAENIPLDKVATELPKITKQTDSIYFICQGGMRSQKACQCLQELNFQNAISIEGGTIAAEAAGLPIIKGERSVIALERQVRIAAGILVLLGILSAKFINPDFIWLSAFVGAGLIFAGITDTCGMALLLARMPWNRK